MACRSQVERAREAQRRWRESLGPGGWAAWQREYRRQNRERVRDYQARYMRQWRRENYAHYIAWRRAYEARP